VLSRGRSITKETTDVRDPVPSERVIEELLVHEARWQLVALLRPIWLKRRVVGRATFAAMIASLVVAFLIPSKYESTTQLMPPDSSSAGNLAVLSALDGGGSFGGGGGMASMASDFLGLKSSGALFIGVLGSRTIQDGIINALDLRKVYSVRTYERARKILTERTTLAEDRKSGIVTLQVIDRNPQRASAIARTYVDQLNLVLAQSSTSSARRERMFLEERLKVVKQHLDDSEKRFSEFSSAKGVLDVKEQTRAMVEGAATIQGELIAAESEERGLEQIYTPNNIRVQTLRARIAELKSQLNKMGNGSATAAASDGQLDENTLYPSLRQLPLLGVTWADLYRESRISEIVYETLTKQYEMSKVQEAKEIPEARVLDEPDVPEKKSSPNRMLLTGVGTLLGLLSAMAFIVASQSWNQRNADDPVKMFFSEVWSDTSSTWNANAKRQMLLRSIAAFFRKSPGTDSDGTNGAR
jgi:uncharacterized protein involved in exopolysaccharide biosynthesis